MAGLMRTNWATADDNEVWDSIRANPDAVPRNWCQAQTDGSIILKDVANRGTYKNVLLDPLTFVYELPIRPRPDDAAACDRLLHEAHNANKTIEVRLFSVANAFDHYLGEWVVDDHTLSPSRNFVTLKRLKDQSPVLAKAYRINKRPRSRSEARHLTTLSHLLPGWRIAHEPEAAVGLDQPMVSGGKRNEFAGDSYTHDYVAASPRGCRRLCVESKFNRAGLDEEAMQKCRALRDSALSRVVAVVDHGVDLFYFDFGPPGSTKADEKEFSATQTEELKVALGVQSQRNSDDVANLPTKSCFST